MRGRGSIRTLEEGCEGGKRCVEHEIMIFSLADRALKRCVEAWHI